MTLADVLTVPGVAGSAALITGLIQLLKGTPVPTDGNEKVLSLIFAAILVIMATISLGIITLPSVFLAFVAWLSIAKLATGIYDEVTQKPSAFTAKEPDTDNNPL